MALRIGGEGTRATVAAMAAVARRWEVEEAWPYGDPRISLRSVATQAAMATAGRTARWGARQTWRAGRASARAAVSRVDRNAVITRARKLCAHAREQGWSLWSTDSRLSIGSVRSHQSILSMFSLYSAGSVGSIGSAGSM